MLRPKVCPLWSNVAPAFWVRFGRNGPVLVHMPQAPAHFGKILHPSFWAEFGQSGVALVQTPQSTGWPNVAPYFLSNMRPKWVGVIQSQQSTESGPVLFKYHKVPPTLVKCCPPSFCPPPPPPRPLAPTSTSQSRRLASGRYASIITLPRFWEIYFKFRLRFCEISKHHDRASLLGNLKTVQTSHGASLLGMLCHFSDN